MRIFLLLVIAAFHITASASEAFWASPIDEKYLEKSAVLFEVFSTARDILNNYSGRSADLNEADILLFDILQEDPNFAPVYREYGRLFIMAGHKNYSNFRAGSLGTAEAVILKAIELEPEYADAYVLLGHLYTKMERFSDADSALNKAEIIGTESPWLKLNRAEWFSKQRDYRGALVLYQQVVNNGTPNRKAYAKALSGVTTAYWNLDELDKTNEGYLSEIEFEPDNAWNWGNYADFLLFYYDDVDGAIEAGANALSIMNYGMGRLTLACALYTKWAQLLHDANTKEEAQKYFEQAEFLYPDIDKLVYKLIKSEYTHQAGVELAKIDAQRKRVAIKEGVIHVSEGFANAKKNADLAEASMYPVDMNRLLAAQGAIAIRAFPACAAETGELPSSFTVVLKIDDSGKVTQSWRKGYAPFSDCMQNELASSLSFKPSRQPFFTSFEYTHDE